MVGAVALKELRHNLLTFRVTASVALTLLLTLLSAIIGLQDYQERLRAYWAARADDEARLAEVRVYSHLRPTIFRPPSPLSVLSRGAGERLGEAITISPRRVPDQMMAGGRENPYLALQPPFDLSTIVTVVLGLLAILLSFDAVCGEKEAGTLRLLLSYPLPRPALLLAKYCGGMLTLAVPLVASALLVLVLFALYAPEALEGGGPLVILLMHGAYFLYLSLLLLLGLLISTLTRRPSTALLAGVVAWLLVVAFIPNVAGFVASAVVHVPPLREQEAEVRAIQEEVARDVAEQEKGLPASRPLGELSVFGDDGEILVRLGRPERYAWLERLYGFEAERWVQAAAQIREVRSRRESEQMRQGQLATTLARLSPAFLLADLGEGIARTHGGDEERFLGQARAYRNVLLDYIRSKGGLTGRRWFTDDPPDQEPFVLDPQHFDRNRMDMERGWRMLREAEEDRSRILELRDMPRFALQEAPLAGVLADRRWDWGLLLFGNLLLFPLYSLAFLRYDAR